MDLCVENEIIKLKKEEKLIVDEWELDSPQSKLRKVLAELYAKSMIARYSDISKEHCEGCGYNAPSQRHHDCILISLKDRIEILFDELIKRANEEDINEMALETMCEETNEIKDLISKTKEDNKWVGRVKDLMLKPLPF